MQLDSILSTIDTLIFIASKRVKEIVDGKSLGENIQCREIVTEGRAGLSDILGDKGNQLPRTWYIC